MSVPVVRLRTGAPMRDRPGTPLLDRLAKRIEFTADGCWLWGGRVHIVSGYGELDIKQVPRKAHRLLYEEVVQPVPEGLELDHLCRVRHCVNPDHLEPVTRSENIRRGALPEILRRRCRENPPRLGTGKRR